MPEYYATRSFSSYLKKNGIYVDGNLSIDNAYLKNLTQQNIKAQQIGRAHV